jgi:hypothetical protein
MEKLPAYQGLDYVAALHMYSNRATVDREGRDRPWIAELVPSAEQPESWRSRRARWEGRHDRWWIRSYRHAGAILDGEIVTSCSPHTWARSDVRPRDETAEIISCGNTRNVFWSVPAYEARWGEEVG